MNDKEDEIELDAPPVKEIVQFFSGEGNPEFVATAELEQAVAFYASVQLTKKQAEEHMKEAGKRIKDLLKADSITQKRYVAKVGKWSVIITHRDGSVKMDYEKYIEEHVGPEAVRELSEIKELVKKGQATSKYATRGEGSVSLEVV